MEHLRAPAHGTGGCHTQVFQNAERDREAIEPSELRKLTGSYQNARRRQENHAAHPLKQPLMDRQVLRRCKTERLFVQDLFDSCRNDVRLFCTIFFSCRIFFIITGTPIFQVEFILTKSSLRSARSRQESPCCCILKAPTGIRLSPSTAGKRVAARMDISPLRWI